MRTWHAAAVAVALSALLGGCSSLETPQQRSTLFDRQGTDVVVDHQNGVAYTFKSANDTDKGCRSPSPDVVVGSSTAFNESMPLKLLGSEQAAGNTQFDTAMLGGRSPTVLISREILFRGCELASNYPLTTEQVLALFRDSLEKIVLIVQTAKPQSGTPPGSTAGSASATLTATSPAPLVTNGSASSPAETAATPSGDPGAAGTDATAGGGQ